MQPVERIDIEALPGRWTSRATGQTIDLVRCGEGWCGIRIGDGGRCADLAMRLTAGDVPPQAIRLEGSFDRRPGTDRHAVQGSLFRIRESGERVIVMIGEPGARLQLMRRVFPYSDRWTRTGEASCTTEAKVS